MKSICLFILLCLQLISCQEKKSSCTPYLDLVKDGKKERKTTSVSLSDSTKYELDYVRDQNYKDYPTFCYGHLEISERNFTNALKSITDKHRSDNTYMFYTICQDSDICRGEVLEYKDIKALLVNYTDKDNNAYFDFIDLKTNKTETHRDSGFASVYIYFLMKKSGVTHLPSIIEFRNKDFNLKSVKPLDRRKDPLYKLANR